MALDPFADIRCRACGWVHYRELRCPSPPALGWLFESFVLERLARLVALGATIFVKAPTERTRP